MKTEKKTKKNTKFLSPGDRSHNLSEEEEEQKYQIQQNSMDYSSSPNYSRLSLESGRTIHPLQNSGTGSKGRSSMGFGL